MTKNEIEQMATECEEALGIARKENQEYDELYRAYVKIRAVEQAILKALLDRVMQGKH